MDMPQRKIEPNSEAHEASRLIGDSAETDSSKADTIPSGKLREPPTRSASTLFSRVEGSSARAPWASDPDQDRIRMLALQQARTSTWAWDLSTDAFRCNSESAGLYGNRSQSPPRTGDAWLLRIHRDDRERVAAVFTSCREGRSERICIEYRVNLDETRTRWLLTRGGLEHPFHRDLRRMIGTTLDVTALRALPAFVESAEHALRRQMYEAIGQISGGVAHDLNNLLGLVSNLAELQQRVDGPSQMAEFSRQIVAAAQRGALLTQKLASLAKPGIPCTLALPECLGTMKELLRLSAGQDVAIRLDIGTDSWPVHVDASELQLAVINLAINSGHAMPDGGTFKVTTVNSAMSDDQWKLLRLPPGDFVEIRVTDTGLGMSADTLSRAFEPYFTTKSAGKGTGLGLAQVQAFARNSGGTVQATSTLGVGSSFVLYLPRASGAPSTA